LINVGAVLNNPAFVRTMTLRRPTATMADGVERTTYEDSAIVASVQPARPSEIAALPEGSRSKEIVAIYTRTELKCEPATQDVIVVGDASYRAVKLEAWPDNGYFVAFCERFRA
jgi:hypothetical protein